MASPDTNTAWVIDGYSLSTHPDLCDRVKQINEAAGNRATFRYLYGKPVLVAPNGVIVAFASGTHIFCVRLPRATIDERVTAERTERWSDAPVVRAKQVQLEALLADEWTRLDPWAVAMPDQDGLTGLAAVVARSVENAERCSTPPGS